MSHAPSNGCSCGEGERTVLLYACSGGANVGEIADQACRTLMSEGAGQMFCLAGVGADLPTMMQQAQGADLNVVVDGCPVQCGRRIFERAGLSNARYVQVTDLGIEKAPKGTRATPSAVDAVVEHVRQLVLAH